MSQPINQYQHRVPRVYLKQFSFKRDSKWHVSVLDRLKKHSERKLVDSFTAEVNLFDYDFFDDIALRRHFELSCQRVEGQYDIVIKTIHNQRRLIPRHRAILCDFVTSLVCRSEPNRRIYGDLIRDRTTRKRFTDEITMFKETDREIFEETAWNRLTLDGQQKAVVGVAANHLSRSFRSFKFLVLEAPKVDGREWPTSDNPVIIDRQNNRGFILPVETEIYLPLSRDYCLFMYHESSTEVSNPLRKLKENQVHKANIVSHAFIAMKITLNANRFIIFPREIDVNLDEVILPF